VTKYLLNLFAFLQASAGHPGAPDETAARRTNPGFRPIRWILHRVNSMDSTRLTERSRPSPPSAGTRETADLRIDRAIHAAQDYLVRRQDPSGYWFAELIGDSMLESDYVMVMHFLGRVDENKQRRLLKYVLSQQNPDGGWSIYHGSPSNPDVTLKAYFALRLAGYTDDDPRIRKARRRIVDLGGIEATTSYTKFYLALFGQYDWEKLPAMIPEIALLPPHRLGFNLYRISSWTRTIVIPMLILYALRPRVEIPFSVHDLLIPYTPRPAPSLKKAFWHTVFRLADRVMCIYDRVHIKSLRRRALDRARRWMLERAMQPGGLGAIYPPMINTVLALKALGYGPDSPEMRKAVRDLADLEIADDGIMRVQPCFSAIWDTAWAVHVLARGGRVDSPAVQHGADWLLSKEVFTGGDWQVNCPGVEPAAWAFEFDNPVYPDTDDTAAVLMALHFAGRGRDPGFKKAVRWLEAMQNPDGGWGAFDRGVACEIFENIPWADHNALLDPSTVDLSGRIIEAFGYIGRRTDDPMVARAIDFLKRSQEPDGSWYGRWGVNYIYGTWQVLVGLRAVGQDMSEAWVRRAADWLVRVQNPDGGWGESCRSYDDIGFKAAGVCTPSQTAWGLLGLLAAGLTLLDAPVRRAVDHLLDTQRTGGSWDETENTGTGFPRVFYLVYTMYRDYFPLLALQMVRDAAAPRSGGKAAS
jgi:squalene-hopene/tetraprenyl-beta-curcumene cyclase